MKEALTPRLNKYIPHKPTIKQMAFLSPSVNVVREVLYGGAAGGGKSDALLMGALQYVDISGYAAILFRQTYTDLTLPEALIPRAHEWLQPTDARWSEKTKSWTFPSGATLTFAYLEHEKDKFRYQSSAYQYIGFDELTQFTESQYTYLFSRLRRLEGVQVPLRMRTATNPGGPGHDWVKQRFIIEKKPNRIFIPARLDDNPHLDREEYIESLNELDPTTRQQLLDGDWEALPAGYMFKREWFKVIDELPSGEWGWVRFWDLAATEKTGANDPDATVGLLQGTSGGRFCVADVRRVFKTAGDVKQLVRQTAEEDGPEVAVRMEQEPGASGKSVVEDYQRFVLPDFDFKGVPSSGNKEVRARPVAGMAGNGHFTMLCAEWNRPFIDEVTRFPMKGVHDDQVDALSGAYSTLVEQQIVTREIEWFDLEDIYSR